MVNRPNGSPVGLIDPVGPVDHRLNTQSQTYLSFEVQADLEGVACGRLAAAMTSPSQETTPGLETPIQSDVGGYENAEICP